MYQRWLLSLFSDEEFHKLDDPMISPSFRTQVPQFFMKLGDFVIVDSISNFHFGNDGIVAFFILGRNGARLVFNTGSKARPACPASSP